MLHRQLNLRSFPPNQRLRQLARNQPAHPIATKMKKKIKKNIFHFKKFKHDFLLIMIFKRLILFWINNHHHACIKKTHVMRQNNQDFSQNAVFFLKFLIQKLVIIKKNYLIIHSFYSILALMIIGHNALTKKINQTMIFLNFVAVIKHFHTKKLNHLSLNNSNTTFKLCKHL